MTTCCCARPPRAHVDSSVSVHRVASLQRTCEWLLMNEATSAQGEAEPQRQQTARDDGYMRVLAAVRAACGVEGATRSKL